MKIVIWISIACGCIALLVGISIALFLLTTPRPTDIKSCIETEMFHVRLCPTDGNYAKIKEISANMKSAVIVSEDGNFYNHQGIDWYEMRESFDRNWQRGEFARGGSTITQQLAKNVYLNGEKSVLRKVREALIAVQLEDILSKDEILEKYLNVVEFGDHLYGIKPAAKFYFNKTPARLSIAESAFLAFLLPSPTRYSTSFKKKKLTKFAKSRMQEIIHRLVAYRKISDDDEALALNEVDHFFGTGDLQITPTDDDSAPSDEESLPPIEGL